MVEKTTLEKSLKDNFFFIVGPCVIESEDLLITCAKEIQRVQKKYNVPFIFKSSFDKANRSSIDSYRGIGMKKGLAALKKIRGIGMKKGLKKNFPCPLLQMFTKLIK